MSSIGICAIIWLLIGIVATIVVIEFDRREGSDLLFSELVTLLLFSLTGPIYALAVIYHIINTRGDKVILKGRKK